MSKIRADCPSCGSSCVSVDSWDTNSRLAPEGFKLIMYQFRCIQCHGKFRKARLEKKGSTRIWE